MNKIIIAFIFCIFLASIVFAEQQTIGPFERDQPITLFQICGNCTFNNISKILFPNGSTAVSNVAMSKQNTFYNYTFFVENNHVLGRYIVNGFGDLDGVITGWNYDFFITPSGKQVQVGESGVVIFLVVAVFIASIILFVFGLFLPRGIIKLFVYGLSAVFLIAGMMFTITISQSYIENNDPLVTAYQYIVFGLQILGTALFVIVLMIVIIKVFASLRQSQRFAE